MPTTEIVSFVLAENADTAHALSIPARQPGCLGHSGGRKSEDARIFVWFILDWETLEDHERFMQNPAEYGALHAALEGWMLSDPTILHVDFDSLAVLRAPVLDVYFADGDADLTFAAGTQSVRGQLVEDKNTAVVVTGLQSESTAVQPPKGGERAYRVVTAVRWWPDESKRAL
ncbi:hypothetical protein AURDEDRAFT_171133 [Auricularia subglabra TFB-10046 SS5]|nr:hypothetical protein AURDEDRAFT_171133 [Auricularia subglabra TFB-10046 SS5]